MCVSSSAQREREIIFHWENDIHLCCQTLAVSLSSPSRQTDVFTTQPCLPMQERVLTHNPLGEINRLPAPFH